MISKYMYKVLKRIPHTPQVTSFIELSEGKIFNNYVLLSDTLKEALNNKYIAYSIKSPLNEISHSPFELTEQGQVAIEEYRSQKDSSAKATWAIIISILSLVVSVIAIIVEI